MENKMEKEFSLRVREYKGKEFGREEEESSGMMKKLKVNLNLFKVSS